MNCPNCQTQNPHGARFCLHCGVALVQHCPSCQIELPGGARFCLNCGQPLVARTPADDARLSRLAAAAPAQLATKVRAAAKLAGEQRTVTALFVDIVDSTALARQLDKAGWAALLNGALDRCHPAIYRYEGTIAQQVGDELLAFFGAPVAHEDDPVRAVRAALDLVAAMRLYAQEVRRQYGVEFAVRVSLSTGPVVVDAIDGDLGYQYSALGGGVNLAARVGMLQRPMAVLISEETCSLIAPFFSVADLGLVQVSDASVPVRVYEVLGPKMEPGPAGDGAGLDSPLVGREAELAALLRIDSTVRAGLGRAVLVVGEPGIGKSRLVAEWRSAAATREGTALRWAQAACLSYSHELAYHLLTELLRAVIGVPAGAGEPQTRAALYALTQDLFGWTEPSAVPTVSRADGEPDVSIRPDAGRGLQVYAALGHLLSLKLEGWAAERMRDLTPEALRALYLDALRRLFRALAARCPLALVLENLHWADPSSIDLLIHLLPLASNTPLLFVLATRPDRDAPGWQLVVAARDILGGILTEIALDTLHEAASRRLVANLLGQKSVPTAVLDPILHRAEGNPLFVEQVIRMLIDRGAIRQAEGGWVTGESLAGIEIPGSLQRLLQARIDRLPDDIKDLLRVASVIGRQFPVRVLEWVLGGQENGAELVHSLVRLESAGLVCVDQTMPELVYRFGNVLMQDAAYSSVLASDRRRLHLAVGRALEALYPEQLASRELAPMLARHFDRGHAASRAYHYARLAGDAALGSYANREAEQHYRHAAELADADVPPSARAELLLGLGESLHRQSRYRDAIQTWRQGIALYMEDGDGDGAAQLYARSARAAWYAGDAAESVRLCEEGLAAVAHAPDSPGIAVLIHEAGRAHFFTQSPLDRVRPLLERALDMAERLGAVAVQADALATLGMLPDLDSQAAVDALHKAVELAEGAGLPVQAHRAHNNLAILLQERLGDLAGAREHYERAAELSRRSGSVEGEIIALSNMASAAMWTGEFARAEATFAARRALIGEAANPGPAEAGLRISEALLLRHRGELAEGSRLLERCAEEAREQRSDQHLLLCIEFWVTIAIEAGGSLAGETPDGGSPAPVPAAGPAAAGTAWAPVEALLEEAIEIGDRARAQKDVWTRCLLGAVYATQHRPEKAHRALAEAREAVGVRSIPLDECWVSWTEARVAAAEERWEEALAAFEATARRCARLGIRWWWARALHEWADAHSARGEPADLERALVLLRQAQALYKELGTPTYVRQVEGRLQVVGAAIHAEMVARHEVVRELAAAREIQRSFLPEALPHLDGWQLAVALEPAREVSGDFYDVQRLPDGRVGLLVADVAGKGVGAALYMALCWTLFRTYVREYPAHPDQVLGAVNHHILIETRANQFLTVFYGILDTVTGRLEFSSAGHCPPYLVRAQEGNGSSGGPGRSGGLGSLDIQELVGHGAPLGLFAGEVWAAQTAQLHPGDVLVLYTDGITEARNAQKEFFGEERLLDVMRAHRKECARDIQAAIMGAVDAFMGDSVRSDDITLAVLVHNP